MTPCYRGRQHGSMRCVTHGRPCSDHHGPPPSGRGWRSSAPNKSATIHVRRPPREATAPTGARYATRSSRLNPTADTARAAASSGSRRWSITSSRSDWYRNVASIRPTASRCAGRVIGANPIAAMAASGEHPRVAVGSNDRGGPRESFRVARKTGPVSRISACAKLAIGCCGARPANT